MTDRAVLLQRAKAAMWFNAVDFGDYQTCGRDDPGAKWFNGSLFGTYDLLSTIDLKGMRCIDIGAGSGVVALGLKALGASYVAAVDAIPHDSIKLAIELSGEDIDYRTVGVENLTKVAEWLGSFDLVVSSGLMYHLLSPFELVVAAKRLAKPNALLVFQTFHDLQDTNRAGMYLNTSRNINSDPSTFWVPSITAVQGMLQAGCFDIIARRSLVHKNAFTAWLCRAVNDPDLVQNRPINLKKMHDAAKRGYNFGGYDFATLIAEGPASTIAHQETAADLLIDESKFDCKFPYNPKEMKNVLGRSGGRAKITS